MPQLRLVVDACLADQDDRRILADFVGRESTIRWYSSIAEILSTVGDTQRQLIVGELGRSVLWNVTADTLPTWDRSVPLLLRAELTSGSAHDLVSLSRAGANVFVSLRGFDDFARDLDRVALGTAEGPESVILDRVESMGLASRTTHIITGAVILGRRRTTVADLSRVCGSSMRALEWRLARNRLPQARALLGWTLGLHAAWSLDRCGTSIKSATADLAFPNRTAFGNYIKRHLGISPGRLAEPGSFVRILERFLNTLSAGSTAQS